MKDGNQGINGDLVLVEILNVYCSGCQKQVPAYHKLLNTIEKDPATKGRIKFLGIAAGNDQREVTAFREKFDIPFPIVPDPQFEVHRTLGGPRTPYSLYVRQDAAGGPGVVAERKK